MFHPTPSFPKELLEASHKERLEYFSTGFILQHEILKEIHESLNKKLFKPELYQIILVSGPTGAGKTVVAMNGLDDTFRQATELKMETKLPAIYLETPKLGGAQFSWKGFYSRLLESMMYPDLNRVRQVITSGYEADVHLFSGKSLSENQLRKRVEDRIKELNVKVIILDELQHMFAFTEANVKTNLDVLKSIANITKCQMVLVGTYEGISKIQWNGQLARRAEKIHFHRYKLDTESNQKAFLTAYSGLLSHVCFDLDEALLNSENIAEIYVRCLGCIGILKQMIEKALADLSTDDTLTHSKIILNSLDARELRQIYHEIEEGEVEFSQTDYTEIASLMGLPTKKAKKRKGRPGVLKPVRDPIK
ncbi:TniB family NTP-binding protein [Saccharospirillum alexandrii]|uniref:TniB family NTP-binding protein n=1 Tax=Saccharospirillum alexandrii TaxID=2448477 RepID=UPI000FD82427|nr:TniB family NTP-binding protein [Saccharospirillum alexandrii]